MSKVLSAKRRVFFALWPDHESAEHLTALAHNLVSQPSSRTGVRLIPPDNLHLTLVFVGSVSTQQIEQLEALAGSISAPAFAVCLDKFGFWPQGGTLWAGCEQRSPYHQHQLLTTFQKTLSNLIYSAGFAVPSVAAVPAVPFFPHVTLARRVRGVDLPRLGSPMHWQANEFCLIESRREAAGVRYETLARFPLYEA